MLKLPGNKQKKKKDKLWSACLTRYQQYNQDNVVMPNVQPQRRHPQRPLRPQQLQQQQQYQRILVPTSRQQQQQSIVDQQDLPSPAFFLSNCYDDAEMEYGSEEMSSEQDFETRIDGYRYGSYGDSSTDYNEGDDYDHRYSNWPAGAELIPGRPCQQPPQTLSSISNRNQNISNNLSPMNCCCTNGDSTSNESSVGKSPHQNHNQNYSLNNNLLVTPPTPHSTMRPARTATTENLFLRCCHGIGSQSSIASYTYPQNNQNYTLNNNNAIGINNNFYEQKSTTKNDSSSGITKTKELFEALMKKLKNPQLDTLYQVVENRSGTDVKNGHQLSKCILVPRESIGGAEPNVIACRLLLWPDLKNSVELKRTPICPNGKDKVYICCNPAHWSRILIPEAAPPPYQESVMDRLKPEDRAPSENSKDGGVSTVSGTTTGLRVQIPESFTTNGEDHSSPSLIWCQIAYWELGERVGKKYEVKNSTINIYSEGSGGMCLKELAEKKCTATSSCVQKTRQKIGLGITLSQEADGVWLYNRSEAYIFVHSPTLSDDWRHVSKVPPGYCLNAFDKNRARTQKLVCPPQIAGAQTGPIDSFSMKISFVKGWGSMYHRANINDCPCWLEILFSRR